MENTNYLVYKLYKHERPKSKSKIMINGIPF